MTASEWKIRTEGEIKMHDEMWANTSILRFLGGFLPLPGPAGWLMLPPEDQLIRNPEDFCADPTGLRRPDPTPGRFGCLSRAPQGISTET